MLSLAKSKSKSDNPNIVIGPAPPENQREPHTVYIQTRPNGPNDPKPPPGATRIEKGKSYPIGKNKSAFSKTEDADAVAKTVASWGNFSDSPSSGSKSFGAFSSSNSDRFNAYKSVGGFGASGAGKNLASELDANNGCSIS